MTDRILTASVVAKAALAVLENELGVVKTFYRAHEDEWGNTVNGYKKGSSINIRRPEDGTVRVGAVASNTSVIEGSVALTVDQQIGTDFNFSSADLTLNVADLTERVIKPRMTNIVNYMVSDCLTTLYRGTYNYVGTPATTFSGFASFARGAERMDQLAIPSSDRAACLSPTDKWGFLGPSVSLNVQGIANPAYREGDVGRVAGIETYMSQVTPTHTTGTRAGGTLNSGTLSVTYDSVRSTMVQTLTVTSVTGIANAGDVFTLAGVNMVNPKTKADTGIPQQFVVTTTTASGPTSLVVSPPIIVAGPHQNCTAAPATNAAITWLGAASTAFRQNLFYHKNSMALAVVPLEIPPGTVDAARESYKGISVRVIPYYDGANDVANWRLDLLYGRALIDPRLSVRAGG
jgi:hypothetical protein